MPKKCPPSLLLAVARLDAAVKKRTQAVTRARLHPWLDRECNAAAGHMRAAKDDAARGRCAKAQGSLRYARHMLTKCKRTRGLRGN